VKTKIFLWSIVFVLAHAFAADNTEPMQKITLSDGTKITFLGITYGKHHEAPNYEAIGGNLKTGHWINRPNDVAVAWMEIEDAVKFPNFMILASDRAEANGVAVAADGMAINQVRKGAEVQVEGFELQAYPRWDEKFHLRIFSEYGNGRLSDEKFLATNPHPTEIGNAIAERLPITKTNGDITVTLTNLVGDVPAPPYVRPFPDHGTELPLSDPMFHAVRFGFDLKEKGHAASLWHLESVVITDAAGNYVKANKSFQDNDKIAKLYPFNRTPADDYKGYVFWPGLWPNEPAWNVRLEFSTNSDVSSDEIVMFTNLPVKQVTQQELNEQLAWDGGETNDSKTQIIEKKMKGVRLKMLSPLAVPDLSVPQLAFLSVALNADTDSGMTINPVLVEATDGTGHKLAAPFWITSSPDAGKPHLFQFQYQYPEPNVKTLNLKFALHRSRHVTFTVKPDRSEHAR
jgi:hypothetical protein